MLVELTILKIRWKRWLRDLKGDDAIAGCLCYKLVIVSCWLEVMLLVFAFLLFQVCLPMTIREYFWDAVWLFMKNLCTPVGSFKFFAYIDYRVVCAVKPFFHFLCSFSSSQSLTLHDIVIFRKCLVSMSWSDAELPSHFFSSAQLAEIFY